MMCRPRCDHTGLWADRDAAERRAAGAKAGAAAERGRGEEDADARLRAVDDRLEFVWPMCAAVRSRCGDMCAAHRDRRKHAELESEHASLDGLFGAVKRQAARAAGLDAENAAPREHAARRDTEVGRLLSMLRGGRAGAE